VIDIIQTFGHWWVDHARMFAAIAIAGILMAFGIPLFIGILAGSKQKQEERIRVLAKARADYHEQKGPYSI
jgi:hypothetical protein